MYIAAFKPYFQEYMLLLLRPHQICLGCQYENLDASLTNGNLHEKNIQLKRIDHMLNFKK